MLAYQPNIQSSVRRVILLPIMILASGLLLLAGCAGLPTDRAAQPMELTVLSTGDVGGYVDPCG